MDYFINLEASSVHLKNVKRISETNSTKNHNNEMQSLANEFVAMLVLHIDETNTQPRLLLRSKTSLFGPSHNDLDNLNNHMIAFLLTSLTSEKKSKKGRPAV